MRRAFVAVYVHLVWATWDRSPLLDAAIERAVQRAIEAKATALGADVLAIGGVEDHVHLLVRLPATITIAELARGVKGASAHLVNHRLRPGESFQWQGSYAAFSVGPAPTRDGQGLHRATARTPRARWPSGGLGSRHLRDDAVRHEHHRPGQEGGRLKPRLAGCGHEARLRGLGFRRVQRDAEYLTPCRRPSPRRRAFPKPGLGASWPQSLAGSGCPPGYSVPFRGTAYRRRIPTGHRQPAQAGFVAAGPRGAVSTAGHPCERSPHSGANDDLPNIPGVQRFGRGVARRGARALAYCEPQLSLRCSTWENAR